MVLIVFVLLAFAANSLLCRWALGVWQFDPALFTMVRLIVGAITLTLLVGWRFRTIKTGTSPATLRFWMLGGSLLLYAGAFSWAYLKLDAGTGAFILFASVQLLLQAINIQRHGLPDMARAVGISVSFVGLALLLLPGAQMPSTAAALLMVLAAAGWAMFVVLGQGSSSALRDVHSAFVAASILVLPALLLIKDFGHAWQPWLLAALSGGVASGVGYYAWYQILPSLGLHRAAQLQLLVPVLAVMMGAAVLSERLAVMQMIAMIMIIAGIFWSIRVAKSR